jgi:hypothetical protein
MKIENSLVNTGNGQVQAASGSGENIVYANIEVVTPEAPQPSKICFYLACCFPLGGIWGISRLYLSRGDGKVNSRNGVILLGLTLFFGVGVLGIVDSFLFLIFIGIPVSLIDNVLAYKEHIRNGGGWS